MALKKTPMNQIRKQKLNDTARAQMLKMNSRDLGELMQQEITAVTTDYITQWVGKVNDNAIYLNQDRVARSQTYQELIQFDLYAEVARDTHLSSIINTLRIMVASLPWEVKPFDESGQSKAVAEKVKRNFEQLDNFQQDLYELNDAIFMGFSASEIIWENGYEASIRKLLNRPQRRIQFDVVTAEPKIRTKEQPFFGEPIQPKKMIIHRASSTWENPFGDALAQNVFYLWLFKRMVLKFWASHLESGVAPVPIVKHKPSSNPKLKAEALEIAKGIRVAAYGRIPDNMNLIFAEAKNMAATGATYKDFEEFVNDEMTKAILGQVLTTEGGGRGGSGSRSLGDVHMDVLQARIIFYANALACTLNSSAVRWLTDFNYLKVKGYPRFQFVTKKAVDRKTEAEIVKILHDAGKEVKNSYIEDVLEIPLQEIVNVAAPVKSGTEVDEQGNLIDESNTNNFGGSK